MSQYEASAVSGGSGRQQHYSSVPIDSRRSSSESAATATAEKHKSSMILSSHRKHSLSSESGATANVWLNEVMDSLEGICFDSHPGADSADLASEVDLVSTLPMGGSLAASGSGSSSSSSITASMISGVPSSMISSSSAASSVILDDSGKAMSFGIIFEENNKNMKQAPPSKRRKSSSFASVSRKHSLSHSATSQISLASAIATEPCPPTAATSSSSSVSAVSDFTSHTAEASSIVDPLSSKSIKSSLTDPQSSSVSTISALTTKVDSAPFSSYLPDSLKSSQYVVDISLFDFDELEDMIGDGKSSTVYRVSMRGHSHDLALKRISKFELSSRKWFLNECRMLSTLKLTSSSSVGTVIKSSSAVSSSAVSSSSSSSSLSITSTSDRDLLKDLDTSLTTTSKLDGICQILYIAADAKYYYLVLELGTTDLFNRILSMRGIKEARVKPMTSSLLDTIDYLHREFGLVHMDLKPENIVFTRGDPWIPKLIDFSEHMMVDDSDDSITYSCDGCGTLVYTSPERWKGKCSGSELKKSDIWSVGVIVYECLTNARCFSGTTKTTISANVTQGVWGFPERMRGKTISKMCKAFVAYLLTLDPKRRPSAKLALAHPWFKI